MTYRKFHDTLTKCLTEAQVKAIQEFTFQNYAGVHGHRPKRKVQKQLAYDFIIDFIRNMDVAECVGYLKPIGIPLITAVNLWHRLE